MLFRLALVRTLFFPRLLVYEIYCYFQPLLQGLVVPFMIFFVLVCYLRAVAVFLALSRTFGSVAAQRVEPIGRWPAGRFNIEEFALGFLSLLQPLDPRSDDIIDLGQGRQPQIRGQFLLGLAL